MLQKVCSVPIVTQRDSLQVKHRYAEDCPDMCEGMLGYIRERYEAL
jgi:hypothetical protein